MKTYALVVSGNPLHYKDALNAINGYLFAIKKAPKEYAYKIEPNKTEKMAVIKTLAQLLETDGKLTFYSVANHTGITAIGLYEVEGDYNAADWYNKPACDIDDWRKFITEAIHKKQALNTINKDRKIMMLGDYIATDDAIGRIDMITDEYIAIDFKKREKHHFLLSSFDGSVSLHDYSTTDRYKRSACTNFHHDNFTMADYHIGELKALGQKNKTLPIYAPLNIWNISKLKPHKTN